MISSSKVGIFSFLVGNATMLGVQWLHYSSRWRQFLSAVVRSFRLSFMFSLVIQLKALIVISFFSIFPALEVIRRFSFYPGFWLTEQPPGTYFPVLYRETAADFTFLIENPDSLRCRVSFLDGNAIGLFQVFCGIVQKGYS
jgi:hypothetical protein